MELSGNAAKTCGLCHAYVVVAWGHYIEILFQASLLQLRRETDYSHIQR